MENVKKALAAALVTSLKASGKVENEFWGGMWLPPSTDNALRRHNWLPNDRFCSSHMALGVEVAVIADNTCSQWK